ncbi:GGDEF domain-containing protein [Schinkia azotoformans]|nr:GGDEF domain-containing protein [Schinkia azotoformans]MEC1695472.1 GGDEF domain-containing protein [Schinkia azotoformans]MEC1725752.1 GGDEF domain-containing protein [Schinkia azotoformans]MEC1781760.1 GGDEF domain-containing protein [Schinkia azotoformans]MED4329151.1 GGDEF domain-containing protein [Schinkia azotoformans]
MDNTDNNKYVRLKRRIYLVIFPLLFITNATYWLFSPYVDRFMGLVLPFLCLFFAIVWVLIYYNRLMRTCEIISLGVFGIYHLFRVYSLTGQLEEGIINVYVLWSPIYFVYIFMVLERKKALGYSLFIFLITVAMGIFHFDNPRANDTLIQFYISTILYTLILFYFQRIVSAYIESDILRKNAYYDSLTDIGDHVLKEFSSLVKSYIRSSDFFGRWGGEEFIIISTNQPLAEATQFAERLRGIIENHSFRYVDHVTASFGIACFQPTDVSKILIKRADQALYSAKKNGRNMVKAF